MLGTGKPLKKDFETDFRVSEEGYPPGVSDGEVGCPLQEVPRHELLALLHDPFLKLADIRL
jgi:hypothetical protein